MTLATPAPPALDARAFGRTPIGRGAYVALVFCGSGPRLGEVPSELTFRTRRCFALPDPGAPDDDFARAAGALLPRWPEDRLVPTPGVCFVFDRADHPFARRLAEAGGRAEVDFTSIDALAASLDGASDDRRLDAFLDGLESPPILLGYGHQGTLVARRLAEGRGWTRLRLVEHGADGAQRAERDGHAIITDDDARRDDAPIIETPLHRRARFAAIAGAARAAGRAVHRRGDGAPLPAFFEPCHEGVALDEPGRGALRASGWIVEAKEHDLPLEARIVVEDDVERAGAVIPVLRSGGRRAVAPRERVDLRSFDPEPWTTEGRRRTRAWLAVTEDASAEVFATRAFLRIAWPEATMQALPAEHPGDLGATDLERLLARHVGRCEIAMASQTSAQQAALGVLARHYAPDGTIVEIGSALGGSALLMAAATSDAGGAVHSIDPDTASRDVMRFVFEREGWGARLRQHVTTSDAAIEGLRDEVGTCGLVFVDGLHDEASVRRDLDHYLDLVRPGGALLFHDAEPAWLHVLRVVLDACAGDERLVLRGFVDSLAVVERRA